MLENSILTIIKAEPGIKMVEIIHKLFAFVGMEKVKGFEVTNAIENLMTERKIMFISILDGNKATQYYYEHSVNVMIVKAA